VGMVWPAGKKKENKKSRGEEREIRSKSSITNYSRKDEDQKGKEGWDRKV